MKVQNEMSTRISVDAVKAIGNMNAFRNAIRGASDAWRAQELALKNSGNYADAAKARLSGLNDVIDLQKAKIAELRSRQEDLDASNKKQTAQFVRLERQIQQANRQLASYEAQASRAKNAVRYQASGLAALQRAYKQSQSASAAYVGRLNAEGRKASATVEKYRQLRSSLQNLESQYRKQEFLLRQVANESGKDSAAYVKQREQLDKTATSIAKTRSEMKSMQSSVDRLQPTGIHRIDDAVVKMGNTTEKVRSKMASAFDVIRSHWQAVGAAAVTAGGMMTSAVKKAGSLQDSYRRTSNLLVTGGEKVSEVTRNVNEMQKQGQILSIKYGVSQQKIADAYQELTKRGYTSSQSLGAMRTMLQASAASGDDLNDVVSASTSAMESFGLRANGTAKMLHNTKQAVNEMAYAADMTATDFKNMSVAMEYAGPQAKTLGYNVGQTASAIGILSNNGLEANQAGTGLRKVLNSLIKPTRGADAALKSVGLSTKDFVDKSGKMKSVDDIFKLLNQHTSDLNKQQKGALFKAIFGATGESAGIILADNAKQLDKLDSKVQKAGQNGKYVQDLADKNMNTAKANMKQLKASSDAVTVALGNALLPSLTKVAQGLAKDLDTKQGQHDLRALAKLMGTVADAIGDVIGWMANHTKTVKTFAEVMLNFWAGRKLTNGIGHVRSALSKVNQQLTKMPATKKSTITVDSKKATQGAKDAKRSIDQVPKTKTSKVVVDTKQANSDLKGFSAQTKATAATSKISFASIKMAGVTSIRAIGLAFRANPFGMIITGIQLTVQAFQFLYSHSKGFRKFADGLVKWAKSAGKGIVRWFSSATKSVVKNQEKSNRVQQKANQQNLRSWNNFWRQHIQSAQRNHRLEERQEQQSQRRRSRAIANFNKNMARGSSNLWRQLQRNTNNGVRNTERSWNNMSKRIGRTSSSLWKGMSKGAQEGWRDVERAAQNGAGRVSRWYQQMNKNTSRTVQDMRQQHPKLFNAMYKVVEDRSSLWHDVTTGHWNRVSSDTQHLASDMSNAHRQLFGAMYDKLNDLTHGGLGKIFDGWNNTLHQIHDAVVNVGGAIRSAWHSLMNGIIDVFSQLIDGIIKGINWVLNHVGGDGNLQPINLGHFANGTNGPIAKHQLAVLNDAPGDNYREMVHKKSTGKTILLPAQRNLVMPLEPGDEVLDGKRVAALFKQMGAPVPHADGAIGDFFSGLWNGAKDIEDMAEDALKDVVGFGKSLFRHFVDAVIPKPTDTLGSGLKLDLPGFFATRLKDWMKKQLELLDADSQGVVSRDKFERIAKHAAALMHQQLSEHDIDRLYHQAQTESGVNAGQNGGYDDGDGTGLPIGLFQFKVGTWGAATRHLPANHHNIHSALDQIMAVLADSTWRSDIEQLGEKRGWNPHGYAYGGFVTQHGLYEVAEGNNPEAIIPLDASKRGRAYQLLTEVLARFKGEEGGTTVDDTRMTQQVAQLDRKFAALLDQNQQLLGLIDKLIGVTGSANNPTARYRRTQRDINLAHAQAFS